jgi:hypothetical protein
MAATAERINILRRKHESLDDALRQENRRAYPDESRIKGLKLEKLKVKDEITALSA